MAKTRKPETAAPETAQETQDARDMVQDTQAQETAPDGAQEAAETAQETQETQDVQSQAAPAEYAVTGCGFLNLREAPSLDAPIITQLPRNVGVHMIGEIQGEWCQVTTGLLFGWVMTEYLLPIWE